MNKQFIIPDAAHILSIGILTLSIQETRFKLIHFHNHPDYTEIDHSRKKKDSYCIFERTSNDNLQLVTANDVTVESKMKTGKID